MNTIRVLLANHPVMVPDAVRKLVEDQEDMEVVGDCRGPMKVLQEVGRTKADAVILVQEGTDEPGLCSQLLAIYPDILIVGVVSDMASLFTQQLVSHRNDALIMSPESLVLTLRASIKRS